MVTDWDIQGTNTSLTHHFLVLAEPRKGRVQRMNITPVELCNAEKPENGSVMQTV
jgi:hypothetical protein